MEILTDFIGLLQGNLFFYMRNIVSYRLEKSFVSNPLLIFIKTKIRKRTRAVLKFFKILVLKIAHFNVCLQCSVVLVKTIHDSKSKSQVLFSSKLELKVKTAVTGVFKNCELR